MYITYKEIKYPCVCRPADTMSYHGLPEEFPAPVSGEIVLCADDGFVMRADVAEDYLRQTFESGVLTLTNVPEHEPALKTGPTLSDRVTELEIALAQTDESLIEIYEMIGG